MTASKQRMELMGIRSLFDKFSAQEYHQVQQYFDRVREEHFQK
jgi:hypothetical protein